jgi:hypothetical protein
MRKSMDISEALKILRRGKRVIKRKPKAQTKKTHKFNLKRKSADKIVLPLRLPLSLAKLTDAQRLQWRRTAIIEGRKGVQKFINQARKYVGLIDQKTGREVVLSRPEQHPAYSNPNYWRS